MNVHLQQTLFVALGAKNVYAACKTITCNSDMLLSISIMTVGAMCIGKDTKCECPILKPRRNTL